MPMKKRWNRRLKEGSSSLRQFPSSTKKAPAGAFLVLTFTVSLFYEFSLFLISEMRCSNLFCKISFLRLLIQPVKAKPLNRFDFQAQAPRSAKINGIKNESNQKFPLKSPVETLVAPNTPLLVTVTEAPEVAWFTL